MSNTRIGEFEQAINGLFAFDPGDFTARSSYLGLYLSDTYVMAHLQDATGRQIHLVRPLGTETTPGLSLSIQGEDGVRSDPRGGEFMRGGFLERRVEKECLVISGMSGLWSSGPPQSYQIQAGDRALWRDSGLLDLEGKLLGPGTQLYIPWREAGRSGGTLHTGLFYEVEGRLFDQDMRGFLMLDHIFSPPGETLHGSPMRRRLLGAWNAFATRFEDGGLQYGQFGYGAGPFRYANIVDGDRHLAFAVTGVSPEYDGARLARSLTYHLANGEAWVWRADRNGALRTMIEAAQAQGSNCQIHKGRVTRDGDTRVPRSWYSIIEWFPERLVDDPGDQEIRLPAGL